MCSPVRGHPHVYILVVASSPTGRDEACYSASLSPLVAWYYLEMLSNFWGKPKNLLNASKLPFSQLWMCHVSQDIPGTGPSFSCLVPWWEVLSDVMLFWGFSCVFLGWLVGFRFHFISFHLESWVFSHIFSSADMSLPPSWNRLTLLQNNFILWFMKL